MAAPDPLKKRLELLQMGEAQGKLRPEHQQELDNYRKQGLAKSMGGNDGLTAEARSAADAKTKAAKMLSSQLDEVERLYNEQLKGAGVGSIAEYLPGAMSPGNAKFDAAAQGMMPLARQAFRVPGSGADSDRELPIIGNLIPDRYVPDAANEQRIKQLRRMIAEMEGGAGAPAPVAASANAPDISGFRVVRRK